MTVAVRRKLDVQQTANRMRRLRNRLEPHMRTAVRDFAVAQAARAVNRLMGRAVKIAPHAAELIPPEENGAMLAALEIYYRQAIIAAIDFAAAAIGEDPASYDPIVQRELAQAAERIVGINDVTRQAVRDLLQEANMHGYSLYQIANGVPADDFPGLRDVVEETYAGRAETIARTELAYATQHAAHDDWIASGVQYVEVEDGVDFDEGCAARNGAVVPADTYVEPLHPRCTVCSIPVIEGYSGPVDTEEE